ncbi:hypothetical protein AMTR_s00013p00212530 [Amborella trichopoda]|uniref:PSP proline-rich domain-containing protein n=1 Tax=Amborella trichopoda TaxID=13333 RepID=W1PRT5_AMBTC|nr:hypothetical protein AMTR_s00013p00212530 [Amborella trichopoda]
MKPGILSQKRKEALGMPEGAPPPWLIKMQRYGPPPSYPHLKIPSSNAPIPPGASFAYHPGGWGKPPVVEVSFYDSCIHALIVFAIFYMVFCSLVTDSVKFYYVV